jgi:peptide/nickel transport system ATP-binding protein
LSNLLTVEDLKVVLSKPNTNEEGWVLRGIHLSLGKSERLALVGESGCGKSMTALSILNLLPQPPMKMISGKIRFNDQDLTGLNEHEWRQVRGKGIGVVFQEPLTSLNPVIPAGEQVAETLRIHMGLSECKARQRVLRLFEETGLPDPQRIYYQYPHQLSGGMCQRIMIAMAIACGPALLIADEPTTALDVTVQAQILDLFFRMTEQHRMAVLFITHNLMIVRGHTDRVAILYAGQVVEEGTPLDIFDHPQHPYTEGLLSCQPKFSQKGRVLFSIPGSVPQPFECIPGCAFADRCGRVRDKCRQNPPELTQYRKGHHVRCFYPSEK